MNVKVKEIIKDRPITLEDKEGYKGYSYKSGDACLFEQNKCIERDIFGHDSYESFCTKSGELKPGGFFACHRCDCKTTVDEYEEEYE